MKSATHSTGGRVDDARRKAQRGSRTESADLGTRRGQAKNVLPPRISGRNAHEPGLAPISVIESIAVAARRHDKDHARDALQIGRDGDRCLRPSHEPADGESYTVTPDLEHDRASIADLLVEADVCEVERTSVVHSHDESRRRMNPDPAIEYL